MSKFNLENILKQVGKESNVPSEETLEKNAFFGKLLGFAGKAGKAAGKAGKATSKASKGAADKASKVSKKSVKKTTTKKTAPKTKTKPSGGIDIANPGDALKTVGTIAAPIAVGAVAKKMYDNASASPNTPDGTGLDDDNKSVITTPDGNQGSDNTGGFDRPEFVPPPGGNNGPSDDGSGSETTAPTDSTKIETPAPLKPKPTDIIPPTGNVATPVEPKPKSTTGTDLDDYNKKVKATQDSLQIEQRKSDYDKILNNLLQKQSSVVEESAVEESSSKADTLMSKIAQDPAYGITTPTGQSPIWTHGADSKRGKEILKSMKLDAGKYDATVSDTLFYKNDVGTGFDATH